ncbi:MAG: 1-acyl-sn-glycerol-3-phosphate acyltransferase, partial [Pseudobdellovibrionaceae bacterium]
AAARKTDTVFVKRECGNSRKMAREAVHEALERGQRIAIFPSGTTSISESKVWRKGAFEIAYEKEILVQPFRISYSPLREVAYIDDDFFPTHLGRLFRLKRIQAKIEFHPPVKITDPIKECLAWSNWAREALR